MLVTAVTPTMQKAWTLFYCYFMYRDVWCLSCGLSTFCQTNMMLKMSTYNNKSYSWAIHYCIHENKLKSNF